MAQNVFDHLRPSAPAQQPVQQPQDTIIRRVRDPNEEARKNAAEVRAQQDQVLQQQRFDLDAQRLQMDATLKGIQVEEAQRKAREEAEKVQKAQEAKGDAGLKLRNVIDKIDEVAIDSADNAGWFETGATGSLLKRVPGTAAYDLSENVKTIDANAAFDTLQDMRNNSPTGGALGGIAVAELDLLKSSVANLNTSQSQEQFFSNLARAKQIYLQMLERLDPEAAKAYSQKKGIRFDDKGNPALYFADGEDNREKQDPFGVLSGQNGGGTPPAGGGDGGVTGNDPGYMQIAAGFGDLVQSAGDTIGIVGNPLNATVNALLGTNLSTDMGRTLRNASGLPENGDQMASAINRAASSGLMVGGAARGASNLITGAASNALARFGSTPMVDALTGGSAAASGELARSNGVGPVGQTLATIAGGVAPNAMLGARQVVNGLRGPRGAPPNMEVVQAGERQNIPVRAPDAQPALRGDYAALESSERAGPIISAARASDADAIAARANEVTGGNPFDRADNTALGQSVQNTARRAEADVKGAASTLYTRAEREAPDFVTTPRQTIAFIDSKIAELRAASPTGYNAEISALEGMKSDLGQTGLSVRTLQAQRETVGGRIGDNVQDRNRADRTFTEVLKVAGEELHSSMRATNPRAAEMLKRADAKWGQYKRLQQEVTGLFLGKRGDATAETAARNLNATTRNNYSALRRFMTMATPEEKADFAASFVQNWGANQRGEFTPALYAKNMEKVSDRTLDALVGTEGRKALRDLQVLSNAKTDAMTRMAPSGKAIAGVKGGLRTMMLGTLGLSQGGFVGAVALPMVGNVVSKIGEERAARLMLNPDFTKWLRAAPEATNPQAINRYFQKLETAAAKAPVFAGDVRAFQEALSESFAQSPGRAAANEESDGRSVPPQQ